MRYQKTLLSFDVNVYTAQSTLTITQRNKKSVVCGGALQVASAANVFQSKFTSERLCDAKRSHSKSCRLQRQQTMLQ